MYIYIFKHDQISNFLKWLRYRKKERRIQSSLHKSKFMRRTSAAVIPIPPAFLHLCSSTSNQPEYVRLTSIECQRRRKNCAQGRGGEKKYHQKQLTEWRY